MSTFELTIQRKHEEHWPVVVRYQTKPTALTVWEYGAFDLDLTQLNFLLPGDKKYGRLLGKNLFREEVREVFLGALKEAKAAEPLRVLLIVEADELRPLHWEQLCAPFQGGRWDYLLLNQQTPFSLYLPSQIERRFPPIGRRDLRALLLVAGPEELEDGYGLASFDVPATVASVCTALGEIPCDVLASQEEGAVGKPTLDALCEQLTVERYTLLHIVCHGTYKKDSGETILFFPKGERHRPVTTSELIERLSRLDQAHGLPHFTFLSTCESADPKAESGLGGLGQRLVRELGMPAVLAMTGRISIPTAQSLSTAFYARLCEHGEVDRALGQALVGLQGRYDVTVPALISRLGGRPLFSDALDRPLTESEIRFGLEQARLLFKQRAPVLLPEFDENAVTAQATLGAQADALSPEARRERENALEAINQLCSQALDLSFNALALGQKPPEYDARPPFRGLYPFRAEDREFFFGRAALVEKLTRRLKEHSFLAVLGPSGCGKSSLVLAGLVPAMGLPMIYLTPGSEPLAQMESALAPANRGDGKPALVVVDQFEELFTLCKDGNQRQAFIDRLLELAQEQPLVLTMRADFWGECAAYPALKEEMQAHQELIAPLDAGELRRVMERQADHVRLRFEDGLGDKILEDVQGEPGAMPLLQHALLLLWQRRHGRWLRWQEYKAFGGIKQAIAHTADEVYEGLTRYEKERVRDIFVRLTRLEDVETEGEVRDTRRRVGLAELVPAGSDLSDTVALVNRLADARLVVTGVNNASGQEEVEVAHEALIRHWPRLRNWLDEDRAGLRLREGIREAALEWDKPREDHLLVHRGGRLEDVEALSRQPKFALNELEEAYLQACVDLRERERREREVQQRRELEAARKLAAEQEARADEQAASAARLRRRALVITAVGVVAILLAVLAIAFFIQARGNAERAENNAATATANLAAANAASTLAVGNAATATANLAAANAASTMAIGNAATAQANAVEAQQQAKIARARELAALATNQTDQKFDLALLLSIEAYRMRNSPQTRQALFSTLRYNPQLLRLLLGHSNWVSSVAWSPDGRLASGSGDNTVIVWDLESGLPEMILEGHSYPVNSVAWSPDGRLASGSEGNTVILWDLESGQPELTLVGHSREISSIAWSSGGRLASGSGDKTVIIWDLEHGEPEMILEHSSLVMSVAWSPDGRLASGSCGREDVFSDCIQGEIILWDLESGLPEMTFEGHSDYVNSVAWSPDGRLASGSWSTTIVWDLESGQPEMTLVGHISDVNSVAWSPDGRLASGSSDNTVIVWDLDRGEPEMILQGHFYSIYSVAWSPDGWLASGSLDDSVIVWDLNSVGPAVTLEVHSTVESVAWSPDGRLASGSSDPLAIIWDLESGQPELTLKAQNTWRGIVAWSPDGRLASGSVYNTVIIWDLERGKPDVIIETPFLPLSMAWSSDGRLASGLDYSTIIVWDLESGEPGVTLKEHSNSFSSSVAWSPDGRLASGSADNTIIIWDLESEEPEVILEGHSGEVLSVAWSPDGRLASSSVDKTVIVWDLESGEPELILEGHLDSVKSVAWSPDGRLASGSKDNTIIFWNLESSIPELILEGHSKEVESVAWSPDGRLASGSRDGTVIVWQLKPEVWIKQACQRAGRNLTRAEWDLYLPYEPYRKTCDQWPLETLQE